MSQGHKTSPDNQDFKLSSFNSSEERTWMLQNAKEVILRLEAILWYNGFMQKSCTQQE